MNKSLGLMLVFVCVLGSGLTGRAMAQLTPANPSAAVLKPAEIAKQLDAAKAEHCQAIDDAKKALLHTIETRINTATDAGNLGLVTSLQAAQATAAVDASVPDDVKDASVVAAKRNYESSIKSADGKLNLAYQRAVRDYTRAHELDQAKSTQTEMESLALVDPTAPTAMTAGTYELAASLPTFLTAKNSIFVPLGDRLGIVVPETQFVRTRESDLLSKNFTADFWVYMVKGMHGERRLPAALVGLGEGTSNLVNGGPQDALYLEINPPDQNDGEVNLHRRLASEKTTIGHLKEFDTYVARIQKSGNSVMFVIGTEQSGTLVPQVSVTIDDVRSDSPFLNDKNTHLFFGSGAFEKLAIGKGPAVAKAEIGAVPLVSAAAPANAGGPKSTSTVADPQATKSAPVASDKSASPQTRAAPTTSNQPASAVANAIPSPQQADHEVTVRNASDATEFETLKNGVKFFKGRKYPLVNLPEELAGLKFLPRAPEDNHALILECAAGATVYVIADINTDTKMEHAAHAKFDHAMTDSGFSRMNDNGTLADRLHHLFIYKLTVSKAKRLKIPGISDLEQGGIRSGSVTVVASDLKPGAEAGK